MILKTSIKIKNIEIKNRIAMPPMATATASTDGIVTEAFLEHYRARVSGGNIGLIITEHSYVSLQGKASAGQLSAASDETIEGLAKVVKIVHESGSKIIMQINHAGSRAIKQIIGETTVSASAVKNPAAGEDGEEPRALSKDEILAIENDFAAAALRSKQAGFDGVEIHSAHSYLLNQFFSPITNKRTDEYGADSIENRLRFHTETTKKIRNAVGNDYIVAMRFGGCDYMSGGSTIEDAILATPILINAGIDLLDMTGGMCRYTRNDVQGAGYFSDLSSAVKKVSSVPVILTGGICHITEAEELLKASTADIIGVGRALLKDADWANKEFAAS